MNLKVLMTLAIVAEAAPLQANEDGVILVGKTRVTLDTVVAVFNQGATAEEIVYRYPSLNLADENFDNTIIRDSLGEKVLLLC